MQQKRNRNEKRKVNKKLLFIVELILAILLAIGCSIIGMSNFLWVSNDLYPNPTDVLGHMTKVVYIADQLAQGHFPSWFSYWYNGSTTTQYYVPLSFYLMVPIYWVTNSIMLTYKIFCASVMVIGGMGVWAFCYKKIGRVCGLVGIIAFCLQPLLLASLYREGVIAQGPIFAIMPWFLLLILSFVKKPTKGKYIGVTILVALLILSHAMHAFMICFTTVIVLFIFILTKKITIKDFLITMSSIVFAGVFTAFWSVVGATGIENPGIPYLLPEAAAYTTANLQWFLPNGKNAFFYYSIVVTVISALGLVIYLISMLIKKNNDNHRFYGLACLLLTIATTIFSFGMQLPGFGFLPFSSGMVPGRILTYTAVTGAISCAYVIYMLWNLPKVKFLLRPIALSLIVLMGIEMNPLDKTYQSITSEDFDSMKAVVENKENAFDKGRYQWYGTLNSSEILFLFENNINISRGGNIEGTLHNQVLYNNYVALPLKCYDYIAKQTALWNIRYLLLSDEYQDLGIQLENQLGFEQSEDNRDAFTLYVSKQPSSYYMTDSRNALIISTGMQGFSVEFPNLVQGKSENLWDYSEAELLKYRLIYMIEPVIRTQSQKDEFESMVTKLVNSGVTIMIEPVASKSFELFDVHIEDEFFETSPVFITTVECPYTLQNVVIKNNSNQRLIRGLYGLDEVYANFELKNGSIQNAVLGSKNVGKGKVIFLGAHLSQYLEPVYVRNNGIGALNETIENNSEAVASIYSTLFSYYSVNENYLPEVFNTVMEQHWDYKGGSFTYQSEAAQEIVVSVTYTPRWKATLDGKEIVVGQRENLITLMLPEGEHTVDFHYGITIYGIIGYVISAVGLVLFLLIILFWNWFMKYLEKWNIVFRTYLQMDDHREKVKVPSKHLSLLSKVATSESATTLNLAPMQENGLVKNENSKVGDTPNEAGISEDITDVGNIIYAPIFQETFNENGVKVEIIEIDQDNYSDVDEITPEVDQPTIDEVAIDEVAIKEVAIEEVTINEVTIDEEKIVGYESSDEILLNSDEDEIYLNLDINQDEFIKQTAEDAQLKKVINDYENLEREILNESLKQAVSNCEYHEDIELNKSLMQAVEEDKNLDKDVSNHSMPRSFIIDKSIEKKVSDEDLIQMIDDDGKIQQDEYDEILNQAVRNRMMLNRSQESVDNNSIEVKQEQTRKPLPPNKSVQKQLAIRKSSKKISSRDLLLKDLFLSNISTREQQIQKRKIAARNAKLRNKNQKRYIKLQSKNK